MVFLPKASVQLPSALAIPFFDKLEKMTEKEKDRFLNRVDLLLLLLTWCFVIIALAGPRLINEPQIINREGRNIMMALDLSGSMELADMLMNKRPASRLAIVKEAAKDFVKSRENDKIGLILFGTRAYLQTPLTYDHHSVLERLEDATVGLAGQTTSIGDAIGLAVKRLNEVADKSRIIILLTDGANTSGMLQPLKAAEFAKLDKIKIYTIGLGAQSETSPLNSNFFNATATSDLDEPTLEDIAKMTGGRYFRATDMQSLNAIYDTINQLEMVKQEATSLRIIHEYYPWPLALAFLLFCYCLFRQNKNHFFSFKKEKTL